LGNGGADWHPHMIFMLNRHLSSSSPSNLNLQAFSLVDEIVTLEKSHTGRLKNTASLKLRSAGSRLVIEAAKSSFDGMPKANN
jgi:hypothetical protein